MINYFEVLNVSESAEIEVICSAYKALAKKYHPDNTTLPKDVAEQKMMIINEAYQVLSDDNAKKEYIIQLHSAEKNEKKHYSEQETNNVSQQEANQKMVKKNINFELANDVENNFVIDSDDVVSGLILVVIIVSIVCCVIYFGPDLLRYTWDNFLSSIRQIIGTFTG